MGDVINAHVGSDAEALEHFGWEPALTFYKFAAISSGILFIPKSNLCRLKEISLGGKTLQQMMKYLPYFVGNMCVCQYKLAE